MLTEYWRPIELKLDFVLSYSVHPEVEKNTVGDFRLISAVCLTLTLM